MVQYIRFLSIKLNKVLSKQLHIFVICCALSFYFQSTHILAEDGLDLSNKTHSWIDDINWHGFLSQNFVATDENDFLGSSSNGSFKSNEAALNASWRANESLQFSLQGLYKQIGNAKPKGTRIDYAIVDWRALDTFSHGAGVRLGRLKNPYGFFNETRDVAATNMSILLAESIYIDYLSQLFHSSDGAGFYSHNESNYGTYSFNVQVGRPILNDQITSTLVGNPNTEGDISNELGGFARLAFEDGAGLWRAALSFIHFEGDFSPAASDPAYLTEGTITIEQLLLSLELNLDKWQFVTEIQRRNTEAKNITIFNPEIFEKGLGYYFQVAYSVSPAWKVYLRRDEMFRNKGDKNGKQYLADIKAINPFTETQAHEAFAKDTTLGFRYSPSFEWSYAMEVHQIDGTGWLPNIENPDIAGQKRYWNMFLAQVAYRF
tara:strand:+ start:677 stop:1972 length:1296 start_codon:yes stop_codon:yes gene_type:complete